jgi:broad specificity phosphatase PhoE
MEFKRAAHRNHRYSPDGEWPKGGQAVGTGVSQGELRGGSDEPAQIDRDLMQWNYGDYEELTSREIREKVPGWLLFNDGCPGGETPEQVGDRADRVIARARGEQGNLVLFARGHLLRACFGGALVRIFGERGPPLYPGYRDA